VCAEIAKTSLIDPALACAIVKLYSLALWGSENSTYFNEKLHGIYRAYLHLADSIVALRRAGVIYV
jgi:hypothetical protein